ncbi:hypothetical protein J0H58_07970 [bacterium]|nr:hypothetical protein [bacterium]
MARHRFALALVVALAACEPAVAQDDDEGIKARVGPCKVEEHGHFIRLIHHDILWGMQISGNYLVRADAPNVLGLGTQWEALALVGLHGRWAPTDEPLTYYHRTGPAGAIFHHLRTRKGGVDTTAPVGVVGMNCGTLAAYARRGQTVTFYEAQSELKGLVADSELYFTYLQDARRRGATVEVKFGPARKTLAADADKRFAALFVELFETGFNPRDRLTLEAVRLYADRVTPDGLVAIHISNKNYRLEPVVEQIARELKLVGRVWNDDSESRPGKTAASWVVLARTEADLGELGKNTVEQAKLFGTRSEPLVYLLNKYGPDKDAMEAILAEWGGPEGERNKLTPSLMSVREGPQAAILYQYAIRLRDAGRTGSEATLGKLTEYIFGQMFRRLEADPLVELRTDEHQPGLPLHRPAPKR